MNPPEVNLWTADGGAARLIGLRCERCGARGFPAARRCRHCGSVEVERVTLADRGRIETCTRSDAVAVAEIRLDDGMIVMGRIEPADRARVGARVRFAPADGMVRFKVDD